MRDQPRDAEQLPAKGGTMFLSCERAVEGVVPLIQENGEVDHAEREEHDGEQEPPGRPPVLREPVRADHGPCAGKRSAQAGPGRSLGGVGVGSARAMPVRPGDRQWQSSGAPRPCPDSYPRAATGDSVCCVSDPRRSLSKRQRSVRRMLQRLRRGREPSKGIRLKHLVTMIHSESPRDDLTGPSARSPGYPRRMRRPARRCR